MACLSYDHSVEEFSGLAIVIANDYHDTVGYKRLTGTIKDGEQLSAAFSHVNFCVKRYSNVNLATLMDIISEVRSLKWDKVKDYSCIAILFAGHGTLSDELVLQDGSLVHPGEIISPLLPGKLPHLGLVPKVFLIDACRGSNTTESVLVPRGPSERGGTILEQLQVPSEGNYLIARSTLPKCKAYETGEIGGLWFHTLADYILKMEQEMSLDDILSKVNRHIVNEHGHRSLQQPERMTTINDVVSLKPNKTMFAITSSTTTYCSLLESHLAQNNVTAQYRVQIHVIDTVHYYQGIITIVDIQQLQEIMKYETPYCYVTIDQAHEEVAKLAYISICENFTLLSFDSQRKAMSSTCCAQDSLATDDCFQVSIPESSAGSFSSFAGASTSDSPFTPTVSNSASKLAKPIPNYRTKFHEYCQNEDIQPHCDFVEDRGNHNPRFKCIITIKKDGKVLKKDSEGFYSRKDEAKEAACFNMLQMQLHSREGGTSGQVSWKSKLKEFYDKKGEPNKELKYDTKPAGNGTSPQFISSIYILELGESVQGVISRSKKEAEQSAAKKALAKLEIILAKT